MSSVRSPNLQGLSTIVLLSISFYIVVLVLMHFARTDVNVVEELTAAYFSGSLGWLMRAAIVISALGWGMLVYGLSRGLPMKALPMIGMILLALAALGLLLEGLFMLALGPVPFQALVVAAVLLSVSFGRYEQWRSLRGRSLILAILMVVGFFLVAWSITTGSGIEGLFQRVFIVLTLSWIAVVATHLREVTPSVAEA